ncbi:hypothetical protein AL539_21570 [Vibrio alginolyticus]|nr:hypothetical protein AL539_21570 [Vibrio alginolyticus]
MKTLNKIQSILKHRVAINSLFIFSIQIMNMIAPLLVMPYLSRELSVDNFGMIMIIFSMSAICLVITDFGFNLSATYRISQCRDDKSEVARVVGGVLLSKLLILFLVIIFLVIYNNYSSIVLSNELEFYTVINIICQSFIPFYFYQGIEKVKAMLVSVFLTKFFYVIGVFAFVDNNNYELVILIYAVSNLFSSLILILGIYKNKYYIEKPKFDYTMKLIIDSSQFFLSRAAVLVNSSASTLIVGTFSGANQAALYGASEKIFQASQSVTSSITQALFPYLALNKNSNVLINVLCIVGIPLSLFLFLTSHFTSDILNLIFGHKYIEAYPILNYFLVIIGISFISSMFGYPAFAQLNKVNYANYTVILGSLFQIIFIVFLYLNNGLTAINMVKAVVITEMIILICRLVLYYSVKRTY